VGLVADEVAVRHAYLVTLCFPLAFIIPLTHHVFSSSSSSAAGIIGLLITEITNGLSLTHNGNKK
jgi:hypothetical protein